MYQDFFNKNDDYLDDFKQKVANQKIAAMEEHKSELARSRNNFLGTFAGIALAGIVGWFVLVPQYQQDNKEIPVIRRPQTAVKIKPENPGGMEIPNQDKDVYNIVEKKDVDNTIVENLLPTPEDPKLPDIVPETIDADESSPDMEQLVDAVEAEETPSETSAVASVPDKPDDLLSENKEVVAQDTAKTPVVEEVKTAETKEAPQGNWQIQLIASKNKDAIEKTWNTLSGKYSLLKKYNHEVQSSDLGAQGMIYKLRAGSFLSKSEAQNACAELKKQGLTDCIAKER